MPTRLTIPTSVRKKCTVQQLSAFTNVKLLLANEHEVYPKPALHLGVSDISKRHYIDMGITSTNWGKVVPLVAFPCGLLVVFRGDGLAITCNQVEAFMNFAHHIAEGIEEYRKTKIEEEVVAEKVKKRIQWLKENAGSEKHRAFFESYRVQKMRKKNGVDWKGEICHLDV